MCSADVEDVEKLDGHDMSKHPEENGEKSSNNDSTQEAA